MIVVFVSYFTLDVPHVKMCRAGENNLSIDYGASADGLCPIMTNTDVVIW